MLRFLIVFLGFAALSACSEQVPADGSARIMVMGDSLLAVHANTDRSVADNLQKSLGETVVDRAVVGARYFYALPFSGAAGMRIDAQFRPGDWDWVVINGGGNDLMLGCGCDKCDAQLDKLISEDGRKGAIAETVAQVRATGARVIYVGYLRSPGFWSPVEACGPLGDRMDTRLARMAARDRGVTFLPMSDLVPHGDKSFHGSDLVHPSPKGSAAIAARIARAMAR